MGWGHGVEAGGGIPVIRERSLRLWSALLIACMAGPAGGETQRNVALADEASFLLLETGDPNPPWKTVGRPRVPGYPSALLGSLEQVREEACLTIGYIVRGDGTVSDARVLAATHTSRSAMTRRAFESQALKAVKRWRYEPGPGNADRVPAVAQATVDFSIMGSPNLRSGCQVLETDALIQEMGLR